MLKSRILLFTFTLILSSSLAFATGKKRIPGGEEHWESDMRPLLNGFQWVIPSSNLPSEFKIMAHNNNVAIHHFNGRLYFAWRTAPIHFASHEVEMHVMSTDNMGASWRYETTVKKHSDLREMLFYEVDGRLFLIFAQLGTEAASFDPKRVWRMVLGPRGWSQPHIWINHAEIPWDIRPAQGKIWMTSYTGNHYKSGPSDLKVHFRTTTDGYNWTDVNPKGHVYQGGVSEVSFEFEDNGRMWAITRNEDGDHSGFGSHLVTAEPGDYGNWKFPRKSHPKRFDSPRMFKFDNEIYLVARRNPGSNYDLGYWFLPDSIKRMVYLANYSMREKRTSLYRVNKKKRKMQHLFDFPSAGDTAFPSIVKLSGNKFLVANYTSPLRHKDRRWIWGQLSPEGTQIYFSIIDFKHKSKFLK